MCGWRLCWGQGSCRELQCNGAVAPTGGHCGAARGGGRLALQSHLLGREVLDPSHNDLGHRLALRRGNTRGRGAVLAATALERCEETVLS